MKFVKTLILVILISGIVVFFQNCGSQQNTGLLGSKQSAGAAVDNIITKAPFAYDLVVDTISYNSCVGIGLTDSGVHGLKVGANEGFIDNFGSGAVKAGLKLKSDFLQYMGTNIKPSYPSSIITPAQIQNVLVNSTYNKDAHIQFAVRRTADLSVVHDVIQPAGPVQFSLPRDGTVIFSSLYQEPVLTQLTKNVQFGSAGLVLAEGPRVYNLQPASNPTPIEAVFGFSAIADDTFDLNQPTSTENLGIAERYSETVRNKFNLGSGEKYILAVTYGAIDASGSESSGVDYGLSSPKRKDEKDKTKAFGRSFALQFGLPANAVAAGWKNNVLKSVIESNLNDASPVSGTLWECRKYVIMQQNQWNNPKPKPACVSLISSDLLNSAISTQVKNLRRHYAEAEWNIGLFYDGITVYNPLTRLAQPICLVPKKTECYLPTNEILLPGADVGVNYNPTTECYLTNKVGTSYSSSVDTVKAGGRCAQYASICVRNSTNF